MSFIKKMKGLAIINNVDDTEAQVLSEPVSKSTKKKKKKKQQSNQTRNPPTDLPVFDPMADLTEEARTEEKNEVDYKRKPSCLDHLLYHEKLRIVYVVLLCLLLGLLIPYILGYHFQNTPRPPVRGYCGQNISYRMECLPGKEIMNQEVCYQANCCYDIVLDDMDAPMCFHTIPSDYSYYINSSSDEEFIVTPVERSNNPKPLAYSMDQNKFTLELSSLTETTPEGQESWPLKVLLQRKGEDVVRIKIWDPEHAQDINDDFIEDFPPNWKLDVVVNDAGLRFNISVTRSDTGEEIFNTVFGPLIYSRDYMEVTTRIPTAYLYGLGQRGNFDLIPDFKKREEWSIYNFNDRDDDTFSYSSHPFYMNFERSGMMHGVYLHNAAPVEFAVNPIPAVVFRALGGSLDLRIFAGPTPHDVSKQYMNMIGMPAMPPFWALGHHLCRTSSNSADFESVFEGMTNESLPYESDCVNARLTYPGSFKKLALDDEARVATLKDTGRKFWLAQHPFLSPESTSYAAASDLDLLLKRNGTTINGTDLTYFGMVADEAVGYPDFINEASATWMSTTKEISDLYGHADGVLLFQNSPLNEVNLNYSLAAEVPCNQTYPECCCPQYQVPFLPEGISDLNDHTLCSSLEQPTLSGESNIHFRSHNVYGRYQHKRTYDLKKSQDTTMRPLVTSQSTFPGSGAFGGHFGGNYLPNFASQRKGLVHILQMGLFGVPLTGVPICGSTNKTDTQPTAEMCLRGYQTGAFLPFMMSHYEQDQTPRNPPNLSSGSLSQLMYFIRQRYMMLPYIYNLFYEAYLEGTPVVRPLFYEFPDDKEARSVSTQFMLGNSLMVTPVFRSTGQGESVNLNAHFPPGCWYEFYKGTLVSNSRYGDNQVLPTLLTDVNAHLLGGTIIPMQGNLHEDFNTTTEFRLKPMLLMVALPCKLEGNITTTQSTSTTTEGGNFANPTANPNTDPTTSEPVTEPYPEDTYDAYGKLYMDDGVTPMDQNPVHHNLIFHANMTTLTITRHSAADPTLCSSYPDSNPIGFTTVIDQVHIAGLPPLSKVFLQGRSKTFTQDPDSLYVSVKHLNINWCFRETTTMTWDLI